MKGIFSFILLLTILSFKAHASHIVGGEIEMTYIRGNVYQILVRMYVDNLNATAGVISSETEARIGIFEKFTNKLMSKHTLKRKLIQAVNYGASCANQPDKAVETAALIFFENIDLNPATYNSLNGYYIVYENCCRNGVIANIVNPFNEGMAFYTEFPALTRNGTRFYNNSPRFSLIRGDYPCVGKDFYFDFSGTDSNGDSLAYRLTTPLAGHVDLGGFTEPQPGPYDSIVWRPGFNRLNQIPGNPALGVNPVTGQLYVKATQTGLFVFSVTVDEFRNGVKIGEVKRDFQFLVVNCASNAPPALSLKLPSGNDYNPASDTITLFINADTCFSVLVSDSSTIKYNRPDNVNVQIIKNTLPNGVLSLGSNYSVSPGNDTSSGNLCFKACNLLFIKKDSVFKFSLAFTDAPKCPLSLAFYDTLDVVVKYRPQLNAIPQVGIIGVTGPLKATVGKPLSFQVYGKDEDQNDIITLTATNLADRMSFPNATGSDSITSTFIYTPICDDKDQGLKRVFFIVDDNSCIPENRDTVSIDIFVEDTTTVLPFISPVNLFTPNDDDMNEYFFVPNIPEGNCEYFFRKVSIYNRWGAKIYENTDPKFKWNGEKQPSGLYFYVIDINEKEFKGWINLVR